MMEKLGEGNQGKGPGIPLDLLFKGLLLKEKPRARDMKVPLVFYPYNHRSWGGRTTRSASNHFPPFLLPLRPYPGFRGKVQGQREGRKALVGQGRAREEGGGLVWFGSSVLFWPGQTGGLQEKKKQSISGACWKQELHSSTWLEAGGGEKDSEMHLSTCLMMMKSQLKTTPTFHDLVSR